MVRKLEQGWRHSCAVFSGKKILWVINWTLSTETKTAYEFSQELMVLLREKEIDPMLLVHPAIPILEEHDKTHENELSKTLETLIEKRGNITQAAEALFIHRTTLFRRMNQIKELTGLDLDDSDLMLELQLSYRILDR